MNIKRFDPSKFTASKAKPLPVLLLLDVSGSMNEVVNDAFERTGQTVVEDGQTWEIVRGGESRIEVLNKAVQEMIASLAKEEQLDHEFLVSVITFGATVGVHLPPTKASLVQWTPLAAGGGTPLGEAIATGKQLIEDKEKTPSRAYRPVVVLVSDGKPTDGWEENLASFVGAGRSTKCDRIALAIGAGTDEEMLRKFIAGTPNPLFHASDAAQILEAFQRVTMSVTVRSRSVDPNQIAGVAGSSAASTPSASRPTRSTPAAGMGRAGASGGSEEKAEDGYW